MPDFSKIDGGLFVALKAFETEAEARQDSRVSVRVKFTGDVGALEAAGLNVLRGREGEAVGDIAFSDLGAFTELPAVLFVSGGSKRKLDLDEAAPDVRARASTTLLTDGLWHAEEATGAFTGAADATGEGVIVAIIDTGIDYKHPMFMKQVAPDFKTRILRIWDMGLTPAALADAPDHNLLDSSPRTYGVEFKSGAIEAALNVGPDLAHRDCKGHGTHCAGIAAGGPVTGQNAKFVGIAPKADIIAVKLLDTPENITYFGAPANVPVEYDQQFRDAVLYCLRTAKAENKPVVISMSFGSVSAPGDGLDDDAIWLDGVLDSTKPEDKDHFPKGAIAVTSSGNEGPFVTSSGRRIASVARIEVPAGGEVVVPVEMIDTRGGVNHTRENCSPKFHAPMVRTTFWYRRQGGPDGVRFAVRLPHQTNFSGDMGVGGNFWEGYALRAGSPPRLVSAPPSDSLHRAWAQHAGQVAVSHPAGGTVRRHSFSFGMEPKKNGGVVTYIPGVYEIRIRATADAEVFLACDAASWSSGKNVMFILSGVDQAGLPRSARIHDDPEFTIMDSLGANVLTVAAYDANAQVLDSSGSLVPNPNRHHIADFSSQGPLRNYGDIGAGQNAIAVKPDIAAPGVDVFSAKSVDSVLSLALSVLVQNKAVPFDGTSMAAPMVAGAVALLLDKDRNLTVQDVRNHFAASVRAGVSPSAMPAREHAYGSGMLDAKGARDRL